MPAARKTLSHALLGALFLFCPAFVPAIAQAQEIALCAAANRDDDTTFLKDITKGNDGWLFSSIDFPGQRPFDDDIMSYFSRLQASLRKRNVQLMMVLVPPRGMFSYEQAPAAMLSKYKFEADNARKSYEARLNQLKAVGILAPNVYAAMAGAGDEHAVFFKRDHHWTPKGAEAAAKLIGAEIRKLPFYGSLGKVSVSLADGQTVKNIGSVETYVEKACKTKIPDEEFMTTISKEGTGKSQGLLDDYTPGIALVGTSMSNRDSKDTLNFSGALRHYSGADIANHALSGGGRATSIVHFLQSDEFFQTPPKLLIWESPVNGLSSEGKRMAPLFSQILAQVQGECSEAESLVSADLPVKSGSDLLSDIRKDVTGAKHPYLHLRFTDLSLVNFDIGFTDSSNARKVIPVNRRLRVANSGEYFFEFPEDLQAITRIDFTTKQKAGGTVKVKVCKGG